MPELKQSSPKLKYLFEADFDDGTTYHQGVDDESIYGGANAYSDIRELQKKKKLLYFHLVADAFRAVVDLTDGHFEINGVPLWLDQHLFAKDFRLDYEMETRVDVDITTKVNQALEPEVTDRKLARHYISRVYIGWSAVNNKGKEIKQGFWI